MVQGVGDQAMGFTFSLRPAIEMGGKYLHSQKGQVSKIINPSTTQPLKLQNLPPRNPHLEPVLKTVKSKTARPEP